MATQTQQAMDKAKAPDATASAPRATTPATAPRTPAAPARPGMFAPIGWEPFRRMRDELDRLFEQTFGGWPALMETPGGVERWGLDLEEKDDALVVRAEAPGFDVGDFDVQVRGDHLVLRAVHKAEGDGGREWSRRELFRSIPIPSGIDPAHVQADYHNGILTISLPRPTECQTRRISVRGD